MVNVCFSLGDFEKANLCIQRAQWMFEELKQKHHLFYRSLMVMKPYFCFSVSVHAKDNFVVSGKKASTQSSIPPKNYWTI